VGVALCTAPIVGVQFNAKSRTVITNRMVFFTDITQIKEKHIIGRFLPGLDLRSTTTMAGTEAMIEPAG
jgi:hypothetical protein